MIYKTRTLLTLIGAAGLATAAFAKDIDTSKLPPPANQPGVTYDKDIKPVFDRSCVKCHSGEKPKGKLRLDSLAGVVKGGTDGKVVQPGNSAKSMIILNAAHLGDEEDWMPPPKNKANIPQLTGEQIGLIRAWIDQGAQ
jgi:hypothetical protein